MRVGTVQFFCQHQVMLCFDDTVRHNYEHVLAYMLEGEARQRRLLWYLCNCMCEYGRIIITMQLYTSSKDSLLVLTRYLMQK